MKPVDAREVDGREQRDDAHEPPPNGELGINLPELDQQTHQPLLLLLGPRSGHALRELLRAGALRRPPSPRHGRPRPMARR